MLKRLFGASILACSLAAAGCTTSQTSAAGWGQIASGVGQVIGQTKADAQVAKASAKLSEYCGALRAVSLGATMFAPEKQRAAALKASAIVETICANPPADVAAALVTAADTYAAVKAAGI